MKFFKDTAHWVLTQFRTNTVRSLLLAVPALALVAAGVLWACGAFSAEAFSYLPDRAYLLAETGAPEPQTLEELLHSSAPSVDTLLKNPSIAQELTSAETLADVVDSRLALNNLRNIDSQLSDRIGELSETPAEALAYAAYTAPSSDNAQNPDRQTPVPAAASPAGALDTAAGRALLLSGSPQGGGAQPPQQPASLTQALQRQTEALAGLKSATSRLLAPKSYGELVPLPSTMNMKGVWQSPDEALVHMIPSGDWLPEQGYRLYRVVNGNRELIAEKLAAPSNGLTGVLPVADADLIRALYAQAELTPDELASLGMTAAEFRETAYRADTLGQKPRVSGQLDFLEMQKALITIPSGIGQKIPDTDLQLSQPIYVQGMQENSQYNSSLTKFSILEKFSVIQAEPPAGIDALALLPAGAEKLQLAQSVLSARQQLATLSFVDAEFAEAAGFLVRDDLSALSLAEGAQITYVVESPDGGKSALAVTRGVENALTKPLGLLGYGVDGKVPLRWEQAQDPKERGILSGYIIERKLDGESGFTRISAEPIVIPYTLDETDIYFETPVFFEDTVENGRTASYRICSIDVFGRQSAYSDILTLKVEKVTPPNAPAIAAPALSDDAGQASAAVLDAVALNPGKRGVVLPVFTDSPDTVRFTVYRAVAVGARGFGAPEAIADLAYDNPMAKARDNQKPALTAASLTVQKRINGAGHLMLARYSPAYPNLVYFDADIQEGRTYKYWVSAWDSWNNESAWSQSVSAGVPTGAEPSIPGDLSIAMHPRLLPDFSLDPPGVLQSDVISFSQLGAASDLPERRYAGDAVTDTVASADAEGVRIGRFISGASAPLVIDGKYNNLPEGRYIHLFIGVRGEDVLPDGTARLKWPAYSGDGLGGYAVYYPLFEVKPLEEMQQMTRDQLLQMGRWRRVNEAAVTQNQLVVGGLNGAPGALSLFLVCLEPETPSQASPEAGAENGPGADSPDIAWGSLPEFHIATPEGGEAGAGLPGLLGMLSPSLFDDIPEGGYVYIDWEAPDDPQILYYRVYRSEVQSFKKPVDESALEWTMVGDHVTAPQYTERVEQTFAHYYYYKVTSVSPWGVESAVGAIRRFRVPSTKPPQTPNLLLPLSRKDGVEINFSAVSHCDRYEIYRAAIPVIRDQQLDAALALDRGLFENLFETPSKKDVFLTGMLTMSLQPPLSSDQPGSIRPLGKFKTLAQADGAVIAGKLESLGDERSLEAYNWILGEFGPLALADYRDLSLGMMKRVAWTKVGEVPVEDDTAEEAEAALGLLEPLSFVDTTAEYGVIYLYTVQAWNDDDLGSSRPEPVEATPRRNRPFDPIDGLAGEIDGNTPRITWNAAKMSPLTPEQCIQDTVGYIVYRADQEDGTYYQASPLLFETRWADEGADPSAYNWYKVRVLDTGGYLSDFSEPLLLRRAFVSGLQIIIPKLPDIQADLVAPVIAFESGRFRVIEGTAFQAEYSLTGTEPIAVTLKAATADGAEAKGFSVDAASKRVGAAPNLAPGDYSVTATAANSAGESTASFTLTVLARETAGIPPEITVSGRSFSVIEGTAFSTGYEVAGTEPVTVTVAAADAAGAAVPGFSADAAARRAVGPANLSPGVYTVTLTARNAFGEDSASFTLAVSPIVARGDGVPPELARRRDEYRFQMTAATDFMVQLSATGTAPLIWSLEPVSERMTVPVEASIDEAGVLLVTGSIQPGTYSFVVRVGNAAGSDTEEIFLEVAPLLFPIMPIRPINGRSGSQNAVHVNLAVPAPQARPNDPSAMTNVLNYETDSMKCLNFELKNVSLTTPALGSGLGYSGTAMLDIGYGETIPVEICRASFAKAGSGVSRDTLTEGLVYIEEPFGLESIGVRLVSLEIAPQSNRALVSGYIQSAVEGQNLIGDLYALEFENAQLRQGNIVMTQDLPNIRYEQFTLHDAKELWIRLNGQQVGAKDLITLAGSKISMKSHLETLNNEGLEFVTGALLTFDMQGRMNGTIYTLTEQCVQLLVPGGAALRVDGAALTFVDGSVTGGNLTGKLVLPFEQAGITGEGVPGVYAGPHPEQNEMDRLASGEVTADLKYSLRAGLIKFGETVQQNGLLIVPDDFDLQDKCAWIPIDVPDWNGEGFVMESSTMTPTRIAERSLDIKTQRSQAIVVTPSAVTVDLDRDGFLPKQGGSQTPNETQEPFWVGLVMKGGTLTLPPDFIQKDGGGAIDFNLAEGEMIYDLNGFNYQTYLYSTGGVPADFGEALGGFKDVLVYDCLLDLYANRVNLEINAEVTVDLFLKNRVKVKLYTNKEDNADGDAGEFLCSVAPAMIEDALATGVGLRVDGGWLKPDGMHLNGALALPAPGAAGAEFHSADPLPFTDMLVPADMQMVTREKNPGRRYAAVELDKPVNIEFQGFTMEVRAFDLEYVPPTASALAANEVRLALRGATLLAETIPLSTDTADQLIVNCCIPLKEPIVLYEESHSVLNATFDDCIDISGVLIPKLVQNGDGLVEFEADQLEFAFLKQLQWMPVKSVTRFGYDLENDRCYFAVGLVPNSAGARIGFGAGEVKDFTGIAAYNMTVARDEQGRCVFPDSAGQIEGYIGNLPVHKGSESTFAAGIKGTLIVFRLCEIRDFYFSFERGPAVTAGGSLYLPLDVSSMLGGDGFKKVGTAVIHYSHPDRYFSFSMTLDGIDLVMAKVSGSLGFEYSPRLFGVYLGYPETLAGNIGIYHVGAGVGFRIDKDGDSMIQAKIELGLERDVNVSIVYLRGYLYAGADGAFYFLDNTFSLELYLKGGIEGGIKVGSKRFNIIGFYLDARGKLVSSSPYKKWDLSCSCKVSYSLDLWVCSVEGTVTAKFDQTLG